MEVKIVQKIVENLQQDRGVVLIRVTNRKGSAPRKIGSVCLVDEDGNITGSIGGGVLEYKAAQLAREKLDVQKSHSCHFSLSQKEIDGEGMICGGEVELYIETIYPDDGLAVRIFNEIDRILSDGRNECALITRKVDFHDQHTGDNRMLVVNGTTVLGKMTGIMLPMRQRHCTTLESTDDSCSYIYEPFCPQAEIVIFGAGHIGAAIANLARNLDFKVVVIDDRGDYANKIRFPDAEEIYPLPFEDALEVRPLTGASYVIITTWGHKTDSAVLEHVLKLKVQPAYIGMIGSIRKRNIIFEHLSDIGIEKSRLVSVHCPIGIDINAETPDEIAVSIFAEIIKHKNDKVFSKASL